MGMAVILVMWPGLYLVIPLLVLRAGYGIWLYQFLIIAYLFTFAPPSQRSSIWNLTLIGPVISEECERRRTTTYPISSPMSRRLRWAKNYPRLLDVYKPIKLNYWRFDEILTHLKAALLLWFLTVTCSCCPYLYFGSPFMWVTCFS